MIDSVLTSIERNSDAVGLALNPEDAYVLEKQDKRAIYIGIENGYPLVKIYQISRNTTIKEFVILH